MKRYRPTRHDLYGFIFLLLISAVTLGLTVVVVTAPYVLLSLLALAGLYWAGHVFGDEIAAWMDGREDGDRAIEPLTPGTPTLLPPCACGEPEDPNVTHRADGPCFVVEDPVLAARRARLRQRELDTGVVPLLNADVGANIDPDTFTCDNPECACHGAK